MTVFANGLQVACKVQANKVIAAFPYVCMTPPQTPATPPGVPVPYPTFALDDDTDSGTGTVKIGGKTVTQKNKSYYTKCTGNEAGCAPKKNLITSVNKGKDYAHAWSGNVKMDAEPICRFSDIGTNDHSSAAAGGPPMPNVSSAQPGSFDCATLKIQPYHSLKCPDGYEKEHTVEVRFFAVAGVRDQTLDCCKDYNLDDAPCICMKAKWLAGEEERAKQAGVVGDSEGKKRKTPHNLKTADARNWINDPQNNQNGKLGDFTDTCTKSTAKNHDNPIIPPEVQDQAAECLRKANMKYLKDSMGKTEEEVKNKEYCKSRCKKAQARSAIAKTVRDDLKAGKPPGTSVTVSAADIRKLGPQPPDDYPKEKCP